MWNITTLSLSVSWFIMILFYNVLQKILKLYEASVTQVRFLTKNTNQLENLFEIWMRLSFDFNHTPSSLKPPCFRIWFCLCLQKNKVWKQTYSLGFLNTATLQWCSITYKSLSHLWCESSPAYYANRVGFLLYPVHCNMEISPYVKFNGYS